MSDQPRAYFTGYFVDEFVGNRDAVIARAAELWKERERLFPERVRRMTPDAMDMATGAWAIVVKQAIRELANDR